MYPGALCCQATSGLRGKARRNPLFPRVGKRPLWAKSAVLSTCSGRPCVRKLIDACRLPGMATEAYLTIAMARYAMVIAKASNAGDISLASSFAFLW